MCISQDINLKNRCIFMITQKIGDKIRELRKSQGMSQKEFARAIGVSYGALQSYEYGDIEPREIILHAITARFGLPLNYFNLNTKSSMIGYNISRLARDAETKTIYLNFYDNVRASAGYGSYNDDTIAKKIPISAQFLKEILQVPVREYDVIRAMGDSMEPFIKDNDMILVDRNETVKNGDIVIAILEDSLYVKKYLFDPIQKIIKLTSLNSFYQDIIIEPQEQIQLNIIGVVKARFNIDTSIFR